MFRPRAAAFALFVLPFALVTTSARVSQPAGDPPGVAQEATEKASEVEARKREKVRDLMETMGMKEMTKRSLDQMLSSFEGMQLPDGFLETFKARFDVETVLGFAVDVYCERLDEKTIDAMVTFYATEEGKKLAAALPDITIDSMARGQEYGRRLATEVLQGK